MGRHVIWHDSAFSQAHPVDSIFRMDAPGVGEGETMNDIVTAILILLAVLFILAFIGGACRIGTGDGEGGE